MVQVTQEREGLGGLPHVPEECEEHGEAEILERMSLLEARMERLGDLIEHQMAGQETRESALEKRFEQRVETLLTGLGTRPAEGESGGPDAMEDAVPCDDRGFRADYGRKEAQDHGKERQGSTGFFRRLLNRIGS